jgi:hypothetical protein
MGADRAVHVDAVAAHVPPLSVAKILRALAQAEQPSLFNSWKTGYLFGYLGLHLGKFVYRKGSNDGKSTIYYLNCITCSLYEVVLVLFIIRLASMDILLY